MPCSRPRAGGDGQPGGQIEVSGHDVLLSGNIDPGAGGSLIIDPFNVTITAANGFNHIGAGTVSENFIGNQLNHYVAVDIEASHNILFNAVGSTHVLHGGNGNLTIGAGSNILFDAKTYEIRTQKGFVHLTAGESIGDPGHRLSVVGGTGVTQAGNIVLKATAGDIYLDDVTVRSGGYRVHALFSAQAGGDINATGLIDVEAHGSGAGVPSAHAIVNINAGHDDLLTDITLLGAATGSFARRPCRFLGPGRGQHRHRRVDGAAGQCHRQQWRRPRRCQRRSSGRADSGG